MDSFHAELIELRNKSIRDMNQKSFDKLNHFLSQISLPIDTIKAELCRQASEDTQTSYISVKHTVDLSELFNMEDPIIFYAKEETERKKSGIYNMILSWEYYMNDRSDKNKYILETFFLVNTPIQQLQHMTTEWKNAFPDTYTTLSMNIFRNPKVVELVFEVRYSLESNNSDLITLYL